MFMFIWDKKVVILITTGTFFFVPNDCIFHYLNIPQYTPNLTPGEKLYIHPSSHPEFTPLGGTIIKERVFWLITYTLLHIQKPSVNCDGSSDLEMAISAYHFFFFPNSQNVAKILF